MQIQASAVSCSTKELTGVEGFLREGYGAVHHCTEVSFTAFLKAYITTELARRRNRCLQTGTIGFLFSDKYYPEERGQLSGGQKLARHITTTGLGTIRRSVAFTNYNTQNHVRMYFFLPSEELMEECRVEARNRVLGAR